MRRRRVARLGSVLVLVFSVSACAAGAEISPVATSDTSPITTVEQPVPEDAIQDPVPADSTLPASPMIDMVRLDGPAVQGYAEKHGVTPEKAAEIIIWQATVNERLGAISSLAGPRYAGASFIGPEDNDGEAALFVYIAGPTDAEFAAVERLDGDTRLIEAIGGMDAIDRIADEAAAAASAEFPDAWISVIVDPATGEVEVSAEYVQLEE